VGYDDLVMETASGLHNFRVDERQLAVWIKEWGKGNTIEALAVTISN
jgi:hypothetical protein